MVNKARVHKGTIGKNAGETSVSITKINLCAKCLLLFVSVTLQKIDAESGRRFATRRAPDPRHATFSQKPEFGTVCPDDLICSVAVQESKTCPVTVQHLCSGCPGLQNPFHVYPRVQDLSSGCPGRQILVSRAGFYFFSEIMSFPLLITYIYIYIY